MRRRDAFHSERLFFILITKENTIASPEDAERQQPSH
jgi:hypothetical protein